MNTSSAVRHINRKGILLVFPESNRKDPPSLWYEFFPRTKMRWEWDESGDNRVGDLWHRERLSVSKKVVYSKWYRGKATMIARDVFAAILRLLNPDLPNIEGLSFSSREVLDLLDEDSPLSTKQLKKLTGLVGRSAESAYQRTLKELWSRALIVAYGEVDEGAFPSLAIGSTKQIHEDIWLQASAMTQQEAEELIQSSLPENSPFRKFLDKLRSQKDSN